MYKKNKGQTEAEMLQNRFTAYITTSIRREKIAYLKLAHRRSHIVYEIDEHLNMISDETYFALDLCNLVSIASAISKLNNRERYVVIARAVEDKSFEVIAGKLGLKYKGVTAIYYRAIVKLRNILRGEQDERF